ncbi:hypothetical protein [Salinispira pacifica]
MAENENGTLSNEELARYIEEVRLIKRTLVETEGSFRIFYWAYHVFGSIVLLGTAANVLLSRLAGLSLHDALIFIWMPAFFLSGVVEMMAWLRKSAREQVPLLSPPFVKYVVAFSGYTVGLIVLAFLFIRPGMPVPGITLILVGMMFCVPIQYTHFWFAVEALVLLFVGVLFVLLDVNGIAYSIAAGILVAAVFFVAGMIEAQLNRQAHG